jgi:hypothetical protein
MEKMKPLLNFDNLSLEDLRSIQDSLNTAIIKKHREREEKALYEFREAYKKFREIASEDAMYVEVYCEGCEDTIDIDLVNLLDDFFGL